MENLSMEKISKQSYLSYFEYMMLEPFSLIDGVGLLLDYYLQSRKWQSNEDHRTVRISYKTKLQCLIANYIKVEDLIKVAYKEDDDFRDDDLSEFDLCLSTISPVAFIIIAHSHGLELPNELLEYAGLKVKEKLSYDFVDKMSCQAVAKTLWLEHPDMTTEDIIYHKAIQQYAGGKTKSPSTLRKWISATDTRDPKSKPGPDKKV
jgi:hypothetical protein